MEYYGHNDWRDYHLAHYGVKGMKWKQHRPVSRQKKVGTNGKGVKLSSSPVSLPKKDPGVDTARYYKREHRGKALTWSRKLKSLQKNYDGKSIKYLKKLHFGS